MLEAPGGYDLKPRAYLQRIFSASDWDWTFRNPYGDQPLRIKIQSLPGIGVNHIMLWDTESLLAPDEEVLGIGFDTPLDLHDHKYLGLEVEGSGSGQHVSIMLQDTNGAYRQYQFKVEPGPMRRKELYLPDTELLHRILPLQSGEILKNSHRPFSYGQIARASIWVNNTGAPTPLTLRNVQALEQVYDPPLANPSVQVNGGTELRFCANLHPDGLHDELDSENHPGPWDYLDFDGAAYQVYNGNNKPAFLTFPHRQTVPSFDMATIQSGIVTRVLARRL